MTAPIPVAFYAPLKSPDHPVPSGDRTVARLMWQALERAGFAPTLASRLRTLDLDGDEGEQRRLRDASENEADRIVASVRSGGAVAPRLWFTYHAYYKAPDHLGPLVAQRLGLPYVVAEPSRAGKRATGRWAFAHAASEAGLDRADILLAATATDAEALRRAAPSGQRIVPLPPFLDLAEWPDTSRLPGTGPARLLAIAMMREGDKLASFRILAEALAGLATEDWTLLVAGDGPARAVVERLFTPLGARVAFQGAVAARPALAELYRSSDLLVWPAVNEAYGMALLEAQAMGCPVLAGRYGGVASVVADGVTGVLTPPGDAVAFAQALRGLMRDRPRLDALGRSARAIVRRERGLDGASQILAAALLPLLGRKAA